MDKPKPSGHDVSMSLLIPKKHRHILQDKLDFYTHRKDMRHQKQLKTNCVRKKSQIQMCRKYEINVTPKFRKEFAANKKYIV